VVDLEPEPNTIMCVPPNTNGAGKRGHVAWVTGPVIADKVSVIEVNWVPEYGSDFRDARIHGCEFIHLTPKAVPDPPPPEEDDLTLVAIRSGTSPDPLGPGAVYLVRDAVYGPKRHITAAGDLPGYLAACGQTTPKQIDPFILDRMELGPAISTTITSPPEV
jgi:hypothetical protein